MKKIFVIIITLFNLVAYSQVYTEQWVKCNSNGCELLDPYYTEGVKFEWDGECLEGKAHGFGSAVKYENGKLHSTYKGEYKNGVRSGKGEFNRHLSNEIWTGNFVDGQLVGYGTYENESGDKYEGYLINYSLHGKGVRYYGNGGKFEGTFNNYKPWTGIYTTPDGNEKYYEKSQEVRSFTKNSKSYNPELNKRLTEYFDDNWNRCSVKEAKYYRLITYSAPNVPKGKILDFYMSGQKQSEFNCVYIDYNDESLNYNTGLAYWYYTNGKLSKSCNYGMTNRYQGKVMIYYDSGEKYSESNYLNGVIDGVYRRWYKNGALNIIALYDEGQLSEDKYIEYDENGMGAIVYKENFYKNKLAWEFEKENHLSYVNDYGQLVLNLNHNLSTLRTNNISLNQNNDFSIEAIIQRQTVTDGFGYGLVLGFKDWDNYFEFIISEYGSYKITNHFEGIKIELKEWTQSEYINKGNQRNELKLIKFDDKFIFSINGNIVERLESSIFRANNYGIIASNNGKYLLENLVVKEFVSVEELQQNTPDESNSKPEQEYPKPEISWNGTGSGIIISKDGFIVTNHHVIDNSSYIEVEFRYKEEIKSFKAKVIRTDAVNDLAILKIDDIEFNNLTSIPFKIKTSLSDVGTSVFALGYPMALTVMGKEIKFTDGKISAKSGFMDDITTYQTTVPIQPGSSGGPLFDYDGNLIGINSSGIDYSKADNVAYSIKSSYVISLLDVLPSKVTLPQINQIISKPLVEKIKILSDYVVLVKVM